MFEFLKGHDVVSRKKIKKRKKELRQNGEGEELINKDTGTPSFCTCNLAGFHPLSA